MTRDSSTRARGNRGRGRGGSNHGRRDSSSSFPMPRSPVSPPISPAIETEPVEEYDPRQPELPRPLSPTSLAIARVTGDWNSAASQASSFAQNPQQFQPYGFGGYPSSSYLPGMGVGMGMGAQMLYGQSYVAPHINPRFANAAGFNYQLWAQQAQAQAQQMYWPQQQHQTSSDPHEGYSYSAEQQDQGQQAEEHKASDRAQTVFGRTQGDHVSGDVSVTGSSMEDLWRESNSGEPRDK